MKINDGGSEFIERSGHFKFQVSRPRKSTEMFEEGIYISMHWVLCFQMLGAGNWGKKSKTYNANKSKKAATAVFKRPTTAMAAKATAAGFSSLQQWQINRILITFLRFSATLVENWVKVSCLYWVAANNNNNSHFVVSNARSKKSRPEKPLSPQKKHMKTEKTLFF